MRKIERERKKERGRDREAKRKEEGEKSSSLGPNLDRKGPEHKFFQC